MVLKLFRGDIAERTKRGQISLQDPDALFAGSSPLVVLPTRMFVLDHRVADHNASASHQRQELELQAATIQHERMIALSVARDELVHDAAAHPDKFVLCLLT